MPNPQTFALPSSPEDRKRIKNAIDEMSKSMTRIEAERDLIKETVKTICDDFELPKKAFRKMARTYHKQNFQDEQLAHEEFETLYEELTR